MPPRVRFLPPATSVADSCGGLLSLLSSNKSHGARSSLWIVQIVAQSAGAGARAQGGLAGHVRRRRLLPQGWTSATIGARGGVLPDPCRYSFWGTPADLSSLCRP